MGVIPFELQQFGFEFGTIYETINDILYIFFWGVTSMKRCHLPFFFCRKGEVRCPTIVGMVGGCFVVKNFPPGEVNLLQKMLWKVCKETGVQPSRSSRVPGCFGGFLKGGWVRRWDQN